MSEFSKRLVATRMRRGLKQKELAKKLGIGVGRLSYYERGKREPNIDMIIRICNELHVSPDFLFGFRTQEREDLDDLVRRLAAGGKQ